MSVWFSGCLERLGRALALELYLRFDGLDE